MTFQVRIGDTAVTASTADTEVNSLCGYTIPLQTDSNLGVTLSCSPLAQRGRYALIKRVQGSAFVNTVWDVSEFNVEGTIFSTIYSQR